MEFTLPLLLLVTAGGTVGALAAVGMIIFHVHITSTFPLAVPLEWNLFMIFGICFLFLENGGCAVLDARRPAADRAPSPDRRRDAGARQLPPRPRLVPALDALLRGQLGDDAVALPQGRDGRGEARRDDQEACACGGAPALGVLRRPRPGGADAGVGARLPLDALARAGAQRPDPPRRRQTSRTTTCARASSSPAS